MPKPLKLRETNNPIGLKFHEVMQDKQIVADYAAVARAFDVATPSVYDWIDHGRISKERYPQLVEWSGRPLDWWFDIPRTRASHTSAYVLNDHQAPDLHPKPAYGPWTLEAIGILQRLDEADQRAAVISLRAFVQQIGPPSHGHALSVAADKTMSVANGN